MLVHNGNLYNNRVPESGFKSWFEKLIKSYLKDIDASIAAHGRSQKKPNGIWALSSGDSNVTLWAVKVCSGCECTHLLLSDLVF